MMSVIRRRAALGILSIIIAPHAMASVQTDWSGGPDVLGPVTEWNASFLVAEEAAWRSVPGQLALSAQVREAPIVREIAENELHHGIAFADLNGDGIADAISSRPTADPFNPVGHIKWWEQTGEGDWIEHFVDETYYGGYYVNTADIDGDGDMDVAAASFYGPGDDHDPPPPDGLGRDGHYAWFENVAGDASVWERHIIAHRYWGAQWVEPGDVDGDGDVDLVGASSLTDGIWEADGDIVYLENVDGAGEEWVVHELETDFSSGFEAHLGDIDGDGDLDVVGTDYDRIAWYENRNGDGSEWLRRFVSTDLSGSAFCDLGDIDNDGDLDIMGGALNTSVVVWFENTAGSGSVWDTRYLVSGSGGTTARLHDIDGDGDLDALFGRAYTSDAYFIENVSGDGVVWDPHYISAFDGQIEIVAADVNGDGKLDAAVVDEGYQPTGPGGLTWYDLTTFEPSGELLSSVLDGGASPDWSTMTWDAELPASTSIGVQVRTGNEPLALGPFTAVPESGMDIGELVDPDAQYLQYRLTLDSDDPSVSPIVREIEVETGGEALGDLNGDGSVNVADLLILLAAWGECPEPPADCDADLNDDAVVNVGDLLILLAQWG